MIILLRRNPSFVLFCSELFQVPQNPWYMSQKDNKALFFINRGQVHLFVKYQAIEQSAEDKFHFIY